MLGNAALDVVIGLVFVYLLYSLYATIIMEIISSSFGLRSKNLTYAISRMLMDEKKFSNIFFKGMARVMTSFTQIWGKSMNLTHKHLYIKFFEQPSIKYLGGGGISNKPSYLSAENFSKGVIDALKKDDPDMSMLARIEEGLQSMPVGEETKKQLQSMLDEANNDVVKFRLLLEKWYDDTMQRASGWFKRSTQMILLIIALALVIIFNIDTVAIIKKLSTDKDAREQLVKMAIDFNDDHEALRTALRDKQVSIDTAFAENLEKRLDSLQTIRKVLKQDIDNTETVLASSWNIPDSLPYYAKLPAHVHSDSMVLKYPTTDQQESYLVVHKSIDTKVLRKILPDSLTSVRHWVEISPTRYKLRYIFTTDHFWGYFLTVLALSLGAPFWFDLLNKLVKLRTSKAVSSDPPEAETNAASASASPDRALLNRAG